MFLSFSTSSCLLESIKTGDTHIDAYTPDSLEPAGHRQIAARASGVHGSAT